MSAAVNCKLDAEPDPLGGLVVRVDTDMVTPKDIDQLQIAVTQGSSVLLQDQQLLVGPESLPVEFSVTTPQNDSPMLIRVIGLQEGVARIERSAIVAFPADRLGLLYLPLNYLCDGMVSVTGESSCGATLTCVQGTCQPAAISGSLPDYYQQTSPSGAASQECFDVAKCLADATEMTPNPEGCWFANPEPFAESFNVALRLGLGSPGLCTQNACWIVLSTDSQGFDLTADNRVILPPSVCERSTSENLRIAVSMNPECPIKTKAMPVCATEAGSGIVTGEEPISVGMSQFAAIGDACAGGATHSCAMCGSETRACQGGLWSTFGMCMEQGVCEPDVSETCGTNGIRTCGGNCSWSNCENQRCEGPSTRSCGNCGTQRRSCNNGMWSEWSACEAEGACSPGEMTSCGAGGTQACGGNCQWGPCSEQICGGAVTGACGNCGTQTRICDASTRVWSEWGICEGEGECEPDSTQPCGMSGVRTCGGNCQWDVACTGQLCEGPATQSCGLCGTQTRTCDMNTGQWSDWSECFGQGECEPDEQRQCGNGGTQTCRGDCNWSLLCTGQVCTGPSTRACGNCGTQARVCDSNTGLWSPWSVCFNERECSPGSTRTCGSMGTQSCNSSCRWNAACPGQVCQGPSSSSCGNCGTQTRTCNTSTGSWSGWGRCFDQGCEPGTIRTNMCPPNQQQRCNNACDWSGCECIGDHTMCQGVGCVNLSTNEQHCGQCGHQCGTDFECINGSCVCLGKACANGTVCFDTQNDPNNCGDCGRRCPENAFCSEGNCVCRATGGTSKRFCEPPTVPTPQCVDDQSNPLHCGACGNDCLANEICRGGHCMKCAATICAGVCCETGQFCNSNNRCMCPATAPDFCANHCVNKLTDDDYCGSCDEHCAADYSCIQGACVPDCPPEQQCGSICCPPSESCSNNHCCTSGTTYCGGQCVNTSTSFMHCGGCNASCNQGETCVGGMCEADCQGTVCGSECCSSQQDCSNNHCCPIGATFCGGQCVDTNTNSDHCGACDDACGMNQSCTGGTCVLDCGTRAQCTTGCCQTGQICSNDHCCPSGTTFCGGQCVDTNTNSDHCGGCDDACGMNQSCTGGTCVLDCGTRAQCTTGCCQTGQICSNDHCCPSGTTFCGGQCVDTNTNSDHCGGCDDACGMNQSCTGGTCVLDCGTRAQCATGCCQTGQICSKDHCCPSGNEYCGSQCVNTSSSTAHCGACDSPCNPGETCVSGNCMSTCPANRQCLGECCPPGQMCGEGNTCIPNSEARGN